MFQNYINEQTFVTSQSHIYFSVLLKTNANSKEKAILTASERPENVSARTLNSSCAHNSILANNRS